MFEEWFGTPTEKKREKYKALYYELNDCLTQFTKQLNMLEESVNRYTNDRPSMMTSFIPEDVFSTSELNVHRKVEELKSGQAVDIKKLSRAVDSAYQRYKHYEHLAIQEQREREEQERREREKRQRELKERLNRRG
ncbi:MULTISPECIES: hypothetical protein [unclassified Granulicatella]|uniref:hypothetical protein n=1 Tax=unclassified Granulicatella TaxID=2630493 RepID=UPI001D16B9BE|nr:MULTISPECIES: hypothetical protein [unclassified Granulicatella]